MPLVIAIVAVVAGLILIKYLGLTVAGLLIPEWVLLLLSGGAALGFILFGHNAGKRAGKD